MTGEFERALQKVIGQVAPQAQESTRKDLSGLQARGATSWEGLVAVLHDASAGEDRMRACWLLSRLDDPRAFRELKRALRDSEPRLRAEAARSLGTIGNRRAVPSLIRALQRDSDANTRMGAAYSLGLFYDEGVVEPLLQKLTDPSEDPRVRGFVAEALKLWPRAVPHLISALADPSVEVRFWAAFALGGLGDPAALSALEEIAQTDDAILAGSGA